MLQARGRRRAVSHMALIQRDAQIRALTRLALEGLLRRREALVGRTPCIMCAVRSVASSTLITRPMGLGHTQLRT